METQVLEDVKKETKTIELLSRRKDFEDANIRRDYKFSLGFKNQSEKDEDRIIKGYASTTDKDRGDDIVTMEALIKSKDDLLQDGSKTVFYNHNKGLPIGKVLETELDDKGLIVKIQISKSKDVEDIWTKIKEGVLNSLSIGFRLKKLQIERDNQGNITCFKLIEIELYEVSVVGIPMNPKASIFSVAKKAFKGLQKRMKGIEMKTDDKKEDKNLQKSTENPPVENSKGVSKTEVDEAIKSAMTPIADALKTLTETVTGLAKKSSETPAPATPAPVPTPAENKEEAKSSDGVPSWAKGLIDSVAELKKAVDKKPSRKGIVEEEKETKNNDDDEDEVIEKCLTSIKDAKCVEYVKSIMKDEVAFAKLSKEEQEKATNIYLSLMQKNMSKTKKS